jgi:hypothetical protein
MGIGSSVKEEYIKPFTLREILSDLIDGGIGE